MDLSLVIPLLDEVESLPELTAWIHRVCSAQGYDYEILYIDDGSADGSWAEILRLQKEYPGIRGVKFRRNYGKSAALQMGFQRAEGEVVITMDADLQDSPDEIPELVSMIRNQGYDLVSGWKKVRHDPISKTIPTKLYNAVTRWLSGIRLHDFNCGLKAYKRDVVRSIEVYGEMHRYIPVIAKWAGFSNIGEKVVAHRARPYGKTKFGLNRFINGPLDLISIMFVGKFGKRPMHFFGTLGLISFVIGSLILAYLSYSKLVLGEGRINERPIFYLGILSVIVGVQVFCTGFLAEMMARLGHNRNSYQIETEV